MSKQDCGSVMQCKSCEFCDRDVPRPCKNEQDMAVSPCMHCRETLRQDVVENMHWFSKGLLWLVGARV